MPTTTPLLQVENLKTWFGSRTRPIRAVDGVSLSVPARTTVALVGESGCGKSVTALSLARLVSPAAGFYAGGRILFRGRDVLRMNRGELAELRGGGIAYIFQEPGPALNPVARVGRQVAEAVRLHDPEADSRARTVELLETVGLPQPAHLARRYAHELSGGMQQRVMIAMALACRPQLLVADEPTTALDVTTQAQILVLLRDLQTRFHMSILLITHNLGLVAGYADWVNVMYAGRIVESGPTAATLARPAHPYTRALLHAVPRLHPRPGRERIEGIPGRVPSPAELPWGCKFADRCAAARAACREREPHLTGCDSLPGRQVRCFFPHLDENG